MRRLELPRAAEEAAHEPGRLNLGRIERPRLPKPELAHTQRMMSWLERDPRCGLARHDLMRGDAKGEHAAVGGKLVLELLKQAPVLVHRIDLDHESGAGSFQRQRVE